MSKNLYEVTPGVEFVNGAPVPKSREVRLSEAEARFDVQMGRIELKPAPPKPAQRQTQKKQTGGQPDVRADADEVANEARG